MKKDLVEAREFIEIGLETNLWWHHLDFEIGLTNWDRYAGDLARALPLGEWEQLREVIAVTESIESRAKFIDAVRRDPEMTDDDRLVVSDILLNVKEGEVLVDALAVRLQTARERARRWRR